MPAHRLLVRILVMAALVLALSACAASPVPTDLPAIALDQAALYRLEVALAAFYGLLLLLTPAYSGLVSGRLPIEISTRGAKFAEEASHAAKQEEATIENLEKRFAGVRGELAEARSAINRLKNEASDKR